MASQKIIIPSAFYRISTKAIIWREEQLLLVRENIHWALPGGGLDHGEAARAGLERELQEELAVEGSLTISPEPVLVGFGSGQRRHMNIDLIHFCFICYEVAVEGNVTAGPESKEIRWFERSELDSDTIASGERATIQEIAHDHQRRSN